MRINGIQASWLKLSLGLEGCLEKAYNSELDTVLPPKAHALRAFSYFKPKDTKVVILGQDPYHSVDPSGTSKAWGLAFGYNPFYQGRLDSSLLNIQYELLEIYGAGDFDRTLESWAKQGILLLNTRLTVDIGQPMSHASKFGYEQAIPELLTNLNELNKSIVFLGWGAEAHKYINKLNVDNRAVLTSHPCKYSHTATNKPFTGSKCFDQVNSKLVELGNEEIKWLD